MKGVGRLNAGLICNDSIYDEVTKEIFNHQGMVFKEIHQRSGTDEKFPCVILPRYTDEDYELAREHCEDEDSIVIAEKEIPLNVVSDALGGKFEGTSNDLIYPAINQYEIDLLVKVGEKYQALGLPFARKWFWPNFHKACCVMTHDVDWLYYSPWHFAAIRNKTVPQLIKLAYQSLIHKRNYGNNIPEIILKEKQRSVRSSFFLLTKYGAYQQEFLKALKTLREEDFEIGLHGSYSSYKKIDLLREEKARLEECADVGIRGVRQHELNFLTPLTWRYQEEAGFAYDVTFSYTHKLGFRGGICFPYHPLDVSENKKLSILEIPTSFMDWTVLPRSYDELLETVTRIEEMVEKFNGCLVMNFHNTYQNKETFPEIERFYSNVLDYVKDKNYWVATANDCCSWWLKREGTKMDFMIKNNMIKGKISSSPFPIIMENSDGKKKYVNIKSANFSINLK